MTVSIMEIVDTMTARADGGTRRTYSPEEKRRIVEETLQPGASVSVVARRHDVNANLVFNWRKRYQRTLPAPTMLPVEIAPARVPAPRKSAAPARRASAVRKGRIEIQLAGGHRLQIVGAVDAAVLRQVIDALSR